jgi:probable HAF family extracellular repeat protein
VAFGTTANPTAFFEKENLMTKQTLKHFVLSLACLGLLLSASPGLAQSKLARGQLMRHGLSSAPAVPISRAPQTSTAYNFTFIDFPETSVTGGVAINLGAIPSALEIVGFYGNASAFGTNSFAVRGTVNKGVVNEAFEDVSFPGTSPQSAEDVNDMGQIVGVYLDSSGVFHGYELSGGVFTTIDVPFSGATASAAEGINNAGQIVGGWADSSGNTHGFTLIGGTYTSFDYPAATQTWAYTINNHGDVVGYYTDTSNVTHGYVLSGGTYTSIDVPGAVETLASGNNDHGDVVGVYCTVDSCIPTLAGAEGFLLSKGVFSTISVPGSTYTEADDINNKGIIVGLFKDCSATYRTFLATP